MLARRVARGGQARRSGRRKAVAAPARHRADVREQPSEVENLAEAETEPEVELEADEDMSRLEEGEMEILLTGHAATHGFEDEDNWLIRSEEESWR